MLKKYAFLLFLTGVFCILTIETRAQRLSDDAVRDSAATVTRMFGVKLGTSKPMAYFQENNDANPFDRTTFEAEQENEADSARKHAKAINPAALPRGGDPLAGALQTRGVNPQIQALQVREGINENNASGAYPPDPNGEIGSGQYIQMTNGVKGGSKQTLFAVYDRQGNRIKSPTPVATFWKSFNVDVDPKGDPIVLYDQAAKRWLMSEVEISSLLVALSATEDPLGVWHVYQFAPAKSIAPDFPKWAVWNNAYYATTNEAGRLPIYVANRQQMLAGADTVDFLRVTIPKFLNQDIFQVAAPMDWDGTTAPNAKTPMAVLRIYDDAWDKTAVDRLEIWSIDLNWADQSQTTVHSFFLPTPTSFNSLLCSDPDFFNCLKQPNGVAFDAGEGVLNNRVQYRNFGDHESVVLNFSVDVAGNRRAGIRWYELRKSGSANWSIFQEGTYKPGDASMHRFMASIAMNGAGDIAMGYSAFGADVKPSLFLTGRKAADPPGMMTAPETQIAAGGAYNRQNRFGDYSDMTVDPVDDKTFWFTGEYLRQDSTWSTKIASFIIDYPTPTADLADAWSVHFYPNPASSALNLRIQGSAAAEPVTYQVINELGVAAQSGFMEASGPDFQKSILLTGLPNGLYFLRLKQDALSKTYKFVKQDP